MTMMLLSLVSMVVGGIMQAKNPKGGAISHSPQENSQAQSAKEDLANKRMLVRYVTIEENGERKELQERKDVPATVEDMKIPVIEGYTFKEAQRDTNVQGEYDSIVDFVYEKQK